MARNIWYTRRNNEIRGPFPQGQVTRYILIGRIQMSDELSVDQVRWLAVKNFPEVIPEPMKGDPNDPALQEQIHIARRREDEREAGDRRYHSAQAIAQELLHTQRRSDERRQEESGEMLHHRDIKTNLIRERKTQQEKPRVLLLITVVVALTGAIFAGFKFMPKPTALSLQCEAPVGPKVNWSNCKFEGILLNNVNLADAQLNNANLSGAQLSNSVLTDADLSYANFSRTDFSGSDARRAKLTGTTLRNAVLTQVNLSNSTMGYAILQGADLRKANFQNANLSKADLSGAMIDGANFDGAILTGAIWIDRTECREGSVGTCVK